MKKRVHTPQKLVPFLQGNLGPEISGKFLRKVLQANGCRVNGNVERFASSWLRKGDWVELAPGWKMLGAPSSIHWEILYEDEETLWVNKPADWVCEERECVAQFGKGVHLIHRLDKETTGVLGLAKGAKALAVWSKKFAAREIRKTYLALVDGVPKEQQGEIQTLLQRKRSYQGQTIWGSGSSGLQAITRWKLLQSYDNFSLLQCEPVTGRTHQIRVHLAEMGHPILIDRQYAKRFRASLSPRRALLHAEKLETSEFSVEAPTPKDITCLCGES